MSLLGFHRVLIAIAILFCGGFAAWELAAWRGGGGAAALLLSIGFAAAAVALGYYLRHLSYFLRLEDADRPRR